MHDEKDGQWNKLEGLIHKMLDNPGSDLCGILLSGYTGIRKTYIIEKYLKRYEGTHPVLIARHDPHNATIPYSGFKIALTDFFFKIYNQSTRPEIDTFAGALKKYFGTDFPLLLDYVPEVSILTGENVETIQRSALRIENQLFSLVESLFRFLSDYMKKPLIVFTDDLQWMDASGLNLLKYMLQHLSSEKIIWIGAYQQDEKNMNPLYYMVEELRLAKKIVEDIRIKNLSREEVKIIAENKLANPCHEDLVDICFKLTEGNPSLLMPLLENIKSTSLIWLDDGELHCSKNAIQQEFSLQHTDKFLLERLNKISPHTRKMLFMTACMGGFRDHVLSQPPNGDTVQLDELLAEAASAGFLVAVNKGEYKFATLETAHSSRGDNGNSNGKFSIREIRQETGSLPIVALNDPPASIEEIILRNIPDEERCEIHYTIAKRLYSKGVENLNQEDLLLMTDQFNQSLDLVRKNNEQRLSAELNYKVGSHFKQNNNLVRASYFFKFSADLLRECKLDEISEQLYFVYMERARLEYQLGEFDLAEIHLDHLIEHIKDIRKRAKVFELKVVINNHLGRYRKAVHILKEALHELGLDLPLDENILAEEIQKLKLTLHEDNESPDDDPALKKQEAILKLLYVGGMSLHHTSDVLMTWAALQIINRSNLSRGSPEKAIGNVSYGRMLIIADDIDKGYNFGLKGVQINNALGDISLRCRVYGVFAFYIQPWKKAFKASDEFLNQALVAGRASEDFIGCYILKTHRLNLHLVSGLPLSDIIKLGFEEKHPELELTYYITNYQKNLIEFLLGKSRVFSIPRLQPSWLAATNTIQEERFYRNYVWARYYLLFGYYELAEHAASQANENRKLQEGSPLLPANYQIWFLGITQNWFNYPLEHRKNLIEVLHAILVKIGLWKTHAPENYEPCWWLLNAELLRIQRKHDEATGYYLQSLKTAGTNILHQAITCECLAKHLLAAHDKQDEAKQYLVQARALFGRWGGVAKVNQLSQQYRPIFDEPYEAAHAVSIEMIQHELGGDLEVESLVKKLMVLFLRISASTRVVIESVEVNGDLKHLGHFALVTPTEEIPEAQIEFIPRNKILLAYKSQSIIVVNNAAEDRSYPDNKAHHGAGVKSYLIMPVTIRDHLSLVIYLENIFAADWYTEEIIKWIRITANQGAIIIENARIHEITLKLNEEIRRKMSEQEKLLTEIEDQKNNHLQALMQTQDQERRRIASDLHDSIGSMLSSVKLRFNSMQDDFVTSFPAKASRFTDTIKLLDDAVHELRRIAHNMLPVSLNRFGLQPTLQTFIDQIKSGANLEIELQILGMEQRLDDELEVAIYRICQELVQNVIKHAAATSMRIQLINHKDTINLIVEDNGKGMNKREIAPGLGFITIESKVTTFNGTFSIESQPARGTMILIDIPKKRMSAEGERK
jgi:signal transduction histidine kinase/predicted ATPase